MRIAIAQLNATVGDLAGNAERIVRFAERARAGGAELMVTPELALCGYPPEALLLREDFMEACANALTDVAARVHGIELVVGHPRMEQARRYNSASIVRGGKVVRVYDKQNLPNYTTFDEARYFECAGLTCVFRVGEDAVSAACEARQPAPGSPARKDERVAINICADAWEPEPPRAAREAGAAILLVLNASPYHVRKQELRCHVMQARVAETGLSIVYVNLVGGQDELVFDGASFVMNARGLVTQQLPAFQEALGFVDIVGDEPAPGDVARCPGTEAQVYQALVLSVRDYVTKNGFPGVLLGVSGGIDSALALAVAADALGPDNVHAVMMPSQFTAPMSREDARALAAGLGVRYSEVPIQPIYDTCVAALSGAFAGLPQDRTEENLQSRIRGTLLMALSNKTGALLLTTGNKSEITTGYATLHGDTAGGFAVLRDVEKTLVYRLAIYRNGISPVIPQRVIERAPSAELKAGQRDQDALPPYPVLDAILQAYIHDDLSEGQIVEQGYSSADVRRVIDLLCNAEYKRRHAPIGVRITSRGKDRRYPITNRFRPRT